MTTFTGTFSAVNDATGAIVLAGGEVVDITLAGDGVITPTYLSRGTTVTLAATSGAITIAGTTSTVAALTGQAFGALGTIPANKWGVIVMERVGAGTASFTSGSANYSTGYATEALAIAAIPSQSASKVQVGYITVLASSSGWVAGTDALAGGTGGTPAANTNYYSSPPWAVSLRRVIGGGPEVNLVTYNAAQSAVTYTNTTPNLQRVLLRCMSIPTGGAITYTLTNDFAADAVYTWRDPEGNLLFSITEAGPVVPSNVTLTAGNAVNMAKGADIASAATIDLTNATGNWVNVTGTTTITAITLSAGLQRLVRFTGILTLTNGASLVLPSAANITTAAGDYALFIGDASGVVRCAYYSRATGAPVVSGSVPASSVTAGTFGAGAYTFPNALAIGGTASVTPYTALLTAKGAGGTFFVRDSGGEAYFYGAAAPYYFGTAYAGSSLVLTSGNGTAALTLSSTQGATFASTVNHASTVSVGAATPSNSGAGVTFPATQSASSDVNTLDDYKEGTWTPVITAGTPGNLAVTYTTQQGLYTKIGRAVTVTFYVATASFSYTTASGLIVVTGLPYAAGTSMFFPVSFFQGYTSVTYPILGAQMSGSLSNIYLTKSASGQAPTNALITDFPTAGSVQLAGSFTYYV